MTLPFPTIQLTRTTLMYFLTHSHTSSVVPTKSNWPFAWPNYRWVSRAPSKSPPQTLSQGASSWIVAKHQPLSNRGGGGGVLRFYFEWGMLLKLQNPHPWFVDLIWQQRVAIFRDFSWKIGPFFTIVGCLPYKHRTCLAHSQKKKNTIIKDIFVENWNPCLGISCEKKQPIGSTSLYTLICEYPPPQSSQSDDF